MEEFIALLEQAWKTLNVLSALLLSCSHLFFFCTWGTDTDFVSNAESYPDSMSDLRTGEQSIDMHCCRCSLVSFRIVYFVQFNNMLHMYRMSHQAEGCIRCPLSPNSYFVNRKRQRLKCHCNNVLHLTPLLRKQASCAKLRPRTSITCQVGVRKRPDYWVQDEAPSRRCACCSNEISGKCRYNRQYSEPFCHHA